jgi:hypothetical protein
MTERDEGFTGMRILVRVAWVENGVETNSLINTKMVSRHEITQAMIPDAPIGNTLDLAVQELKKELGLP